MSGKIDFIKFCKVISVEDSYGADMIYAQVMPEDNSADKEHIGEYEKSFKAFPMLPKMFRVKPKPGEAVFVFTTTNDANSQRYYIGPIITQDDRMYNEPYEDAEAYTRGGYTDFGQNKRENDRLNGAFPNDNDVVIRGRKNADIYVTDNDVKLRAGVKKCENGNESNISVNLENPAFVKVKYHENPILDSEVNSTVTVVADKINFFGNKSYDPEVHLTNKERDNELIEDDKLEELMKDAHQLPYGDKLIEILKEIIRVLKDHTHPYSMCKPTQNPLFDKLNQQYTNLLEQEQLLSDTIRIN